MIIAITIITFTLQKEFTDDISWIAENHSLNKIIKPENSENFVELQRNDRSSHR